MLDIDFVKQISDTYALRLAITCCRFLPDETPAGKALYAAKQIMNHAEELMIQAGSPKITLQICFTNQKTVRFYEHIAYRRGFLRDLGIADVPLSGFSVYFLTPEH